MEKPVSNRRLGIGRRSEVVLAAGLVLISLSFGLSVRYLLTEFLPSPAGMAVIGVADESFAVRQVIVVAAHLLIAGAFIWLYLYYMRPAGKAADLLYDSLKKHGNAQPETSALLTTAVAARDRLDKYAGELAKEEREKLQLKDQRFDELMKGHQDLLTQHRCTKKMLQSYRIAEVLETLLKGVREGLGFQGALLGVIDREGNLVFQGDSGNAGRPGVRIPCWDEKSLLASTFWQGKHHLMHTLENQPHKPEDRFVLSEGTTLLVSISRKHNLKCSEVLDCGNMACSAYSRKNDRCWIDHHIDCTPLDAIPSDERKKACALCPLFAPVALLVVRDLLNFRRVSRETIMPILALVNEASLALEVVELHEQMKRMSITDGLTGLVNHREFYVQLRRELERARRYQHAVSLLMIDVDNFKIFNDRHGHLAGDMVLKKIAELLRHCARASDVVARYGGEEFAVILPESTSTGSTMLAERIKSEVSQYNFLPLVPDGGHLTVSIGIYSSVDGYITEDQLVRLADEAAYSAKRSGKNCVVVKAHA